MRFPSGLTVVVRFEPLSASHELIVGLGHDLERALRAATARIRP